MEPLKLNFEPTQAKPIYCKKGIGVSEYAYNEEPNPIFRPYMEDGIFSDFPR